MASWQNVLAPNLAGLLKISLHERQKPSDFTISRDFIFEFCREKIVGPFGSSKTCGIILIYGRNAQGVKAGTAIGILQLPIPDWLSLSAAFSPILNLQCCLWWKCIWQRWWHYCRQLLDAYGCTWIDSLCITATNKNNPSCFCQRSQGKFHWSYSW